MGGWGTFASAEVGSPSAPGQVTASGLTKIYRAGMLDQRTRIFGVIGFPLGQSKGVFLHNALFRSSKSNSVYCRFPVKNLALFMKKLAPMLEGFSVTLPHKVEIMKYLQEVDPEAGAIGAVNTVVRTPHGLRGTNTDGAGALDALEHHGPVDGKKMLIFGAGGAARAVAFSAKQRGADVTVAGRTDSRARKLAADLNVGFTAYKHLNKVPCDIFVNATPVGMTPEIGRTPVPKSLLTGKMVFDVVYNPPVTRLLKEAREAGSVVVPGTEMYCRQAAKQSELYSGKRPPLTRIRKLLGYDQVG
jgi:3-dehydroquinate dehydratase/shikimate dehydrogenase